MPYSYPKSLVAGTPENVNDLNTNLTGAAADWEQAFSMYKTLQSPAGFCSSLGGAGVYALGMGDTVVAQPVTIGAHQRPIFAILPGDHTVTGRALKFRVSAQALANGVAPGVSFVVGLYSVSSITRGTSGNDNQANLSLVTGSTVTLSPPVNNSTGWIQSTDFTVAAQNLYAIAVSLANAQTSGSVVDIVTKLDWHNV